MVASERLKELVALNAPFWAGEAEVFQSYWTWKGRSRESDKTWLSYQCFKEMWDTGLGDKKLGLCHGLLEQLTEQFPKVDRGIDRHTVLDIAEGLTAEFAHYCAFADVYDALCAPGEPTLNPDLLETWPAEQKLAQLRREHRATHGEIGLRATRFTEGGYCRLYAEGMALMGRGGIDDKIAEACVRVYEDEFDHMLKGVAGLDDGNMTDPDWDLLCRLTVEQLKLRIHMRNDQFGKPLSEARIAEIFRGEIEPVAFDWAGAQLAA